MTDYSAGSLGISVEQSVRTPGEFDRAAKELGDQMRNASNALNLALSLNQNETNTDSIREVCKILGIEIKKDDKNQDILPSVQYLQTRAMSFYQTVERTLATLQQLVVSSHQQMMSVVRNIGRS